MSAATLSLSVSRGIASMQGHEGPLLHEVYASGLTRKHGCDV